MKTIKTGSLVTRIFSALLSVLIVLSWSGATYAAMPTKSQHKKAKNVLENRPPAEANVQAIKPVVTETVKPVVTKTTKPVVTKTTKSVVTKTTKPVVTKTTKPVVTKMTKPVVTKTATPVVTPTPSSSQKDIEEQEEGIEHKQRYENDKENAADLVDEGEGETEVNSLPVIEPSSTSTVLTERLLKMVKSYFKMPHKRINYRERMYIPDVEHAFVEIYNTLPSVGLLDEASGHVAGGRVHPKIDENVFKDYPVVTGTTSNFSFVSMQVKKIKGRATCGADVEGFNGLFTISFVNSTGLPDGWAVVVSDYGIPESRADLIQTCFGKASSRTTPFGTMSDDIQYAKNHSVWQIEALLLLVQNGEAEWNGGKLKLDEKAFEKLKEHMAKRIRIAVPLDPAQIDIVR